MPKASLALEHAVVERRDEHRSAANGYAARVSYDRHEDEFFNFVIVDVTVDGRLEFTEQESGELCWYPFQPDRLEVEFVQSLLREDEGMRTPNPKARLFDAPERRRRSAAAKVLAIGEVGVSRRPARVWSRGREPRRSRPRRARPAPAANLEELP
jgi:hypothetical protein